MQTLKDLAQAGHTVVSSIHQPRSSIFSMFDDVLLLSEGGCVYHGPAASALDYFSQQGFDCPERYNPAEFLADLISVDYSAADSERESRWCFVSMNCCVMHEEFPVSQVNHERANMHAAHLGRHQSHSLGCRFVQRSISDAITSWKSSPHARNFAEDDVLW